MAETTAHSNKSTIRLPADPAERARLAESAGLSPEERAAIEQFCFDEARKRAHGIALHASELHR